MRQEFGHVKANAARTDDGHALAHRLAVAQHVDVAQHLGVVLAGDLRVARLHASRDDDLVKARQVGGCDLAVQVQLHAGVLHPRGQVAQHFVELFLARNHLGHVELAADGGCGVKQMHFVPPLGGHGGGRQACGPSADHGHTLARRHRAVHQLGLVAGARVDQAAAGLVLEHMVQAGLVAGDAGVDAVGPALRSLLHKRRIGQQRARHGHHVGAAIGQHLLGHLGRVDAVGRDQRRGDACRGKLGLHLLRDPGERCAGHAGGNGGHPRLVPANAGVDDVGAASGHGLAQGDDLVPRAAAGHQVDHRQAVNDDEVLANGLAHAADDLHRQAHAVAVVTAPFVAPQVGGL